MNCDDAKKMIHSSLDGELSSGQRDRIDSHLASCEGCGVYAKAFGSLKNRTASLAGSADMMPSGAILERACDAVDHPQGIARRVLPAPVSKFPFIYAAAAAVLAAAAVFGVMSVGGSSDSMAATLVREHDLRTAGLLALDVESSRQGDLENLFESAMGSRVEVPAITLVGSSVEGGKVYRDKDGPTFFCAAYRLQDDPVTLYVLCSCPGDPPAGRDIEIDEQSVRINSDGEHTLIFWRAGERAYVLVTSLDEAKSRAIFASLK